jgi:hypothetical protein
MGMATRLRLSSVEKRRVLLLGKIEKARIDPLVLDELEGEERDAVVPARGLIELALGTLGRVWPEALEHCHEIEARRAAREWGEIEDGMEE